MREKISIQKIAKSKISDTDFSNLVFGKTISDHMFVLDYNNGAWHNPRIVPYGPFSINPSMISLHYGQALFEGMKATKGIDGTPYLFRTERHLDRLNKSAERLCMPKLDADLFQNGLKELIRLDQDWIPDSKGSALYIRPLMFATDDFIGVKISSSYRFIIFTGPVGPYYPKPVKLYADEFHVRAAKGGVGEAKAAGNYAASLLPAKLARMKGFDQVLWLDSVEHKYIEEVGTMNIFFVIGETILTPETDGTILHGITRDTFLQLLNEKGYRIEIRPIDIHEIVDAFHNGTLKEAFGAGTAAVVANISQIKFKETLIELPPVKEHKIANWLRSEFNAIRTGQIADRFNWLETVEVAVEV